MRRVGGGRRRTSLYIIDEFPMLVFLAGKIYVYTC